MVDILVKTMSDVFPELKENQSNIEKIMKMDGVTPHIYGKKETRPFRKMGHVTIVNKDINKAREIAQKVKETIKVISK